MLTFQSLFPFYRIPANSKAVITFLKVCERFSYVQREGVLLNVKEKKT